MAVELAVFLSGLLVVGVLLSRLSNAHSRARDARITESTGPADPSFSSSDSAVMSSDSDSGDGGSSDDAGGGDSDGGDTGGSDD